MSPPFNLGGVKREVAEFRIWLAARPFFKERDVVAKLRSLPALCPLIGMYDGRKYPTAQKFEFEIQGVFRADYVAGVPADRHFVLVEFEGAERHSIFGPAGTSQMRSWGNHVQHGFGQISDWSWAKNESQHSRIYKSTFGVEELHETYVLICGRDASLLGYEQSRLFWRNRMTSIANSRVLFQTYDNLVAHFESVLDAVHSFST